VIKRFPIALYIGVFTVAALWLFGSGCSRPLPEAGSAEAKVYVERCGGCHSPYQPGLQTAAMWDLTLARMESTRLRAAGIRLKESDRRAIRDYLTRNAGGR